MRLADELRGIKPRKTLQGRIVNNDDPPEVAQPPAKSQALQRVKAFVEKVEGEFSAHDVMWECAVSRSVVAEYLSRFAKQGLIRRVGYVPVVTPGRVARMNLWRRT